MPMARRRTGASTTSPGPQNGLEIDISGSDYAERSRRLIELTNDLKALGANHLLDIPRVVFIGNQSAGKSSVVEGVTGTKVPRDSGTCTRCPMECTMTKTTGAWHCSIKLRVEFDNNDSNSERPNPLTIPFAELTSPAEVEVWLRRAQAAVLVPGTIGKAQVAPFRLKGSADIRAMQDTPGALVPFSFNTVEMYVQDPRGTDLSFVDLPGIIQHHSTDTNMVALVQQLVKRAIRGLNTLIVLTIPMTDDVENQQAFVLAKEADPQGIRTIGVGTKPDMLQPGNTGLISTWKEILQGNVHKLQHGYYCVMLPDDATRAGNHSRSELQRREQEFFNSTEPWKSVPDRARFGIRNFVGSTSKLLINLIERNLPTLKKEVDKLLKENVAEYEKLPLVIEVDHPLPVVMIRTSSFCRELEKTMLGEVNKDFAHRNKVLYAEFRDEIASTAPQFEDQNGHNSGKRAHHSSSSSSKVITLDKVRTAINNNLTWELPNYIPFEATKYFILQHVCQWKGPAIACFNAVVKNLNQRVDILLDDQDHFGRFVELKRLIREIIAKEEMKFVTEASTMINKLFDLENSVPLYTQNREAYDSERRAWFFDKYNNTPVSELEEDKVMADVHAYFQVASKRFIDLVPLSIEGELHQALASRLGTTLFHAVTAMDSDNLTEMLREDPQIRAKREQLSNRIARLTAIKQRILEYERSVLMLRSETERSVFMPHSE